MAVITRHQIVTFGIFEVDLDAEEVRKAGLRVRLAGQPFRPLAALLARPGEVLTREELQHEIWGDNTNVDFERGLASAINKVREALSDSADHPTYIETIARKGYRFIAPITVSPREAGTPEADSALKEHGPEQAFHSYSGELSHLAYASHPGASPDAPLAVPGLALRGQRAPTPASHRILWAMGACVLVLVTAAVTWRIARGISAPLLPHIEQLTQTNDIYPGPPNPETMLSLVTDGPRLYVPTLVDGRSQLTSVDDNGAYRQPIALPATLSTGAISDISQDGSYLLIRSVMNRDPEQPLWVVPTAGSGAQRVGEVLAHDAVWMPHDPNHVLFATGTDLRIVELGTGEVSPFLSLPGRAFWLRWSPDGRTLRFTLLDPVRHSSRIWEMDADTRKPHQVEFETLRGLNICCGSWTPSGKQFVFQASDARSSNLWLAGTGSQPRLTQLTNGPIRFYSPLPSRDGSQIFAFGTAHTDAVERYDRAHHEFVPAELYLQDSTRVSYSRDGNWAAWTDSRGRLWRARARSGADLLQLTGEDLEVFSAQWSPDGSQLVLMGRRSGQPWQIYTVNAAGGAVTPLLTDARNLADPDWSADGKQIVFGREADLMGQEAGPHDIEILDLATHKTRPLPGSTNLFSPRWSPDGEWIAALSRDQSRLLVFNVRTQSWSTLFTGGAADPVWASDSRAIIFHAFAPEHAAILQVTVNGSLQTLADLTGLRPLVSDNCFFGGVTPDGSPLIKPNVGVGNLYSINLPSN
ncbi:MAG TPA: winged helix-turn-helix domain-containing protein [Acidobacteriaceae bacterium]|jgi:Tol biopolymer transport system component/DNA-binding winged helix-turn-helix (wHTH) protein|nr:winged helix-turn-helix domain-containing protein [Acidobacteriaceae bacterium]